MMHVLGNYMKPGGGEGGFLHYPPSSEEDEKLGMVCTTVGSMEVKPFCEYPPHKNEHPAIFRSVAESRVLPGFHIIYITRGEGIFEAEGHTYTILPGSVLFLLPGMKHRYKPAFEIGWHEYWVGFKGEFFIKLLEEGVLPKGRIFFKIGLHNSIISLYEQILDEVKAQQPLYQLKACATALSLLAEILSLERRGEQPTHYQKIVEKAKFLIESGALHTINLSNISEQLNISTSQLHEIFKTYTSMTPYQYFIQIKIHKAETLLEQTDTPVQEVAYSLGFEDPCYFSRLFKNKTGVTPSQWKKFLKGEQG